MSSEKEFFFCSDLDIFGLKLVQWILSRFVTMVILQVKFRLRAYKNIGFVFTFVDILTQDKNTQPLIKNIDKIVRVFQIKSLTT